MLKDEKILLTYLGKNEDVVIPDSVCEIGSSSFFDRKIRSVKIPDSVHEIGSWAFGMNSPEEIDLPASVKSVWQGSLITTSIIHVHGKVEGLMLTAVNAYHSNSRTANFCVEYEGRWHIFPNRMNPRYGDEAEALITNKRYKKGIHNHFQFANSMEEKLRCAVEIYGIRKDDETGRYLKSNMHILCDLAIGKGEEKFVKFLDMLDGYDMLKPKMMKDLLETIDKNWIQARACLMNMICEGGKASQASFGI